MVIGAEYRPDRTTRGWDFWWRSAAGDVVVVFNGFGGGGSGQELANWVREAITEPEATSLEARARWPIEQAQATAFARRDPNGVGGISFASMACVAVGEGRAAIAHIGNARVYRLMGSSLELLTRDHSLAESQDPEFESMRPFMSAADAARMLLRSVGAKERFAVEVHERACAPGEVLALCTSGVWETYGDELGALLALGHEAPAAVLGHMKAHDPGRPAALAMLFVDGDGARQAAPRAPRDDASSRATSSPVLLALRGMSLSVVADGASIEIALGGEGGMPVTISTADLVELRVRDDERVEARRTIRTGLEPSAGSRWIEAAFLRGQPWLLGPLPAAYAEQLAQAFHAWRAEHPLDITPTIVADRDLFADPTRWHLRRIEVVTTWRYALEVSAVGPAWLEIPDHTPVSYGTYRVRVTGTWVYPGGSANHGYGHMGGSPGMLVAETIDVLEVYEQARQERDGLTGLPKRTALGPALERAVREGGPVAVAILNLDRFKRVNDFQGHKAGDEVLRNWVAAVLGLVRPADVVVRWGADQLAIVFPGATVEVAAELLEGVHAYLRGVGLSVSIGVVEVGAGEAIGGVFERADQAVYEAKKGGRDRTVRGRAR